MLIRIAKICDDASSCRVIRFLSKKFVVALLSLRRRRILRARVELFCRTGVYVANTIACVLRSLLLMVSTALQLRISLLILLQHIGYGDLVAQAEFFSASRAEARATP